MPAPSRIGTPGYTSWGSSFTRGAGWVQERTYPMSNTDLDGDYYVMAWGLNLHRYYHNARKCAACNWYFRDGEDHLMMSGPRRYYGGPEREYPVIHDTKKCLFRWLRRQKCHYCGGPGGQVDHVTPKAKWEDELDFADVDSGQNLLPCCGPCNVSKSDRDVTEWLQNTDRPIKKSLRDRVCVPASLQGVLF